MKKLIYFCTPSGADDTEVQNTNLYRQERTCSDDQLEHEIEIAKRDSYNGEVTVEEVPDEPSAEPTQLDRVEAQATYTAMMTDTLLEV